jgi:23S rRNA (cytosine1962-C5)-methyltransferase
MATHDKGRHAGNRRPGGRRAGNGKHGQIRTAGRAATKNAAPNRDLPGRESAGGMPTLWLQDGRERSLARRHPWIFSGAVQRVEGAVAPGGTVAVRAADGRFLAWAALSPQSNIRARVWSFAEGEAPGEALFRARIQAALAWRAKVLPPTPGQPQGVRLVHAEADGLPGVVVDRYGDVLVVQITTQGAEFWRDTLLKILQEETGCTAIYERSDADVRELEGLKPRTGFASSGPDEVSPGSAQIDSGRILVEEHRLRYRVDVAKGQKTGFFLDQRDNRAAIAEVVAVMVQGGTPPDVLNCFCYTGGFSLSALAAGAKSVLSIDSSAAALELAKANLELNALDTQKADWVEADVFRHLRLLRDQGKAFDLIVLDPPKFAPTSRDAERAARGYKDINLNALKLLRPGGVLATFSCSGGVSAELFQKIVAGAAADAGVSLRLEQRLAASADHPVRLEFPEGEYLKGLLLRCL